MALDVFVGRAPRINKCRVYIYPALSPMVSREDSYIALLRFECLLYTAPNNAMLKLSPSLGITTRQPYNDALALRRS